MTALFNEALREFTKTFSEGVKAVSWTQGIPSFNDGEPCLFSVSEDNFLMYEYVPTGSEEKPYFRGIEYLEHPEDDLDENDLTGNLVKLKLSPLNENSLYSLPISTTFCKLADLFKEHFQETFGDNALVVLDYKGNFETHEYYTDY